MRYKKSVGILVIIIAALSAAVTLTGILSGQGPGAYEHETIRGQVITIYGQGIYRHMSADIAIQGIAQDYITLLFGIPLLLISLYFARKGVIKGMFVLTGALGYFLATYLFYLVMAMYNELFLVYALLTGASFFAFILMLLSFNVRELPNIFSRKAPVKSAGGFLIFNAFAIGLLWLGVVLPPLIDGGIYPAELEHYTTLIVQGMDLSLLLPLAVVSGVLLIRRKSMGFLVAPVYLIFLSVLMLALTAKLIAMWANGDNIIPAIFVIPSFAIVSIIYSVALTGNIKKNYL